MFAGSVQTADGEWAQILTQPLVATDQQNNRSLDTTRLCPVASILSLFLAQRALTTSEKHQTKKESTADHLQLVNRFNHQVVLHRSLCHPHVLYATK